MCDGELWYYSSIEESHYNCSSSHSPNAVCWPDSLTQVLDGLTSSLQTSVVIVNTLKLNLSLCLRRTSQRSLEERGEWNSEHSRKRWIVSLKLRPFCLELELSVFRDRDRWSSYQTRTWRWRKNTVFQPLWESEAIIFLTELFRLTCGVLPNSSFIIIA
jgi:hypothetical protein